MVNWNFGYNDLNWRTTACHGEVRQQQRCQGLDVQKLGRFRKDKTLRVALPVCIIVFLAACGGGGSGGDDTPNEKPLATNDSALTSLNTAVDINVIDNDSDPDGTVEPNSVTVVSPPANGSTTSAGAGMITYTPAAGFTGPTDTFTYSVADNRGLSSDPATVTITIGQKPVAVADNERTTEDTPININVVANDSDPDGVLQVSTVAIVSSPINGNAVSNGDGTVTYTPNQGFTGPADTFSYTVDDDLGLSSDPAIVSVIINQPPVATDACFATPQAVELSGILPVSDPDNSRNELLFSLDQTQGPEKGQVSIDVAGNFTYTPNDPGPRGADQFSFRVEDPDGASSTGTVDVIIHYKIMPLGDSITQGFETSGNPPISLRVGYRKPLYDDLIDGGFNVDFVGSQSNGAGAGLADADHEGHSGATAMDIANGPTPQDSSYDGIFDALEQKPADVVLLHIGTNDLSSTTANDVEEILTEIGNWENSGNGNPVTVILGRIIDQDPFGNTVTSFNDSVVGMAQSRINGGDDIVIVNHEDEFTYPPTNPNDMADDLHPNSNGYQKMSDVWLFPLIGQGAQTGTGTSDDTGAYSGAGILQKCP